LERRLKTIASRDNALFKTLRQLAHHGSARRDEKLAVLEGVHLCEAWLNSSEATGEAPRYCVVGQSSIEHPEVAAIVTTLGDRIPASRSILLDDALFHALSQLEQGVAVLFVIDVPQFALSNGIERIERIERSCAMLDRIQDPGNVGSILRSAAAAGIADIYASRGCASAWSPKVLRAGMGAHFHLRIHEDCDLQNLAAQASIPRLAMSPSATRSIYEFDLTGEVAWMFGHEGQGLDRELMRDAIALSIPQPGRIDSLNVAASAAICFFEQVRQRRNYDCVMPDIACS